MLCFEIRDSLLLNAYCGTGCAAHRLPIRCRDSVRDGTGGRFVVAFIHEHAGAGEVALSCVAGAASVEPVVDDEEQKEEGEG